MVKPEKETVPPSVVTLKMRKLGVPPAVLRWTVKRFARGALIVRLLLIGNSPLVSVIVLLAGRLKLIVSPGEASMID